MRNTALHLISSNIRPGISRDIAQYCHPLNNCRQDCRGQSYGGEFPVDLENAFLSAHADSYGLYTRRLKVDWLRNYLDRAKDELAT